MLLSYFPMISQVYHHTWDLTVLYSSLFLVFGCFFFFFNYEKVYGHMCAIAIWHQNVLFSMTPLNTLHFKSFDENYDSSVEATNKYFINVPVDRDEV